MRTMQVWKFAAGAAGAAVAAGALVLSASAASADPATELFDHTNDVRAANGLAPLASDDGLAAVADSWSQTMASSGELGHNPALRTTATTKMGENVGEGSDVASIA